MFKLAIADNNLESQYDAYIKTLIDTQSIPVSYAHEPRRGYSSARNCALELGLASGAEVLAFVDDDMILDAGWLEGHLRSHTEMTCDAVNGVTRGHRTKKPHGGSMKTAGMRNISFRRDWVEASGLGLRFDPRYNEIGYEDHYFTLAATNRGKIILQSEYPVVIDPSVNDVDWMSELQNKADVATAAHYNRIVNLRTERGVIIATTYAIFNLWRILKMIGLTLEASAYRMFRYQHRSIAALISRQKEWRKVLSAFAALRGNLIPRQDVRRGH
jgi:glycosyltransferase involved in cell wall biosynthesis